MKEPENKKCVYPPQMRNFTPTKGEKIYSYSKNEFVDIPSPDEAGIVVNNIATAEFDYTETMADKDTTK